MGVSKPNQVFGLPNSAPLRSALRESAVSSMARSASLSLLALALVLRSAFAVAGVREEAVLSLMEQLRSDEWAAKDTRLQTLHQTYLASDNQKDHRLVSLALGVNYLDSSPKLALQYLSSAELACRPDDEVLPIVRFYAAEAKLKAGAYLEAAKIGEDLLKEDLGAAWDKQIYGVLIEAYFQQKAADRLAHTFDEYTKKFSFSRRQESMAKMAAESFEAEGDRDAAVDLLEQLAKSYPATEESRWAFHKLEDYA